MHIRCMHIRVYAYILTRIYTPMPGAYTRKHRARGPYAPTHVLGLKLMPSQSPNHELNLTQSKPRTTPHTV
jgi:hypothetical protein